MTATPTLMLTRGVPASGKTTFAEAWVAEAPQWRARVNRDDLRFAMYGEYVLDHMREDAVTTAQHAQVSALLNAGVSVVVDDTNLRSQTVREWITLAQKAGADIDHKDFDVPLEVALQRNQHRSDEGGRFVPEDVIRSFYSRFVRKGRLPDFPQVEPNFTMWEPYVRPEEFKPKAIVVDIDGTLADMSGSGRNPYDYERAGEVDLAENVAAIEDLLYHTGL